jgi:hypothetical protein
VLTLKDETQIETEKQENSLCKSYKLAEEIASTLIVRADEIAIKMSAAILYQVVLGLYDDFYNIRSGRKKKVWEKGLKNHILLMRKAYKILLYYGIISKNQVESFVFENGPLPENLDFAEVASVATGLLVELQEWDTTAFLKYS